MYSSVPALHESVPHIETTEMKIPTTSFMFESELKRLKNNQESFYSYLKVLTRVFVEIILCF